METINTPEETVPHEEVLSGPLLIPLPTPRNAKKKDLKVIEQYNRGGLTVTVYKYKVTNYGYTVTDQNAHAS